MRYSFLAASYMLHGDLPEYVHKFSYLGVYLWFAVLEQLTPIPEEVSLISLGYLCVYTSLNPYMACTAAIAGLLTTDMFLFYISAKGSKMSKRLVQSSQGSMLDTFKKKLREHAAKTIFFMAMIPKLRFLSPIISGAANIKFRIFLIVNSLATLLYSVVYFLLGIIFYRQLNNVIHKLSYWQHIIFIASMVLIAGFAIFLVRNFFKKKTHSAAN